MMRLCHDIGESPEKVNAERAIKPPTLWRYQLKKSTDQFLGRGVVEKFDPGVLTLTRDARAVGDRDHIVLLQAKEAFVPFVADDVTGPHSVNWQVALIVAKCPLVEVRLGEILPELFRKPKRPVTGDYIASAAELGP